MCYSSFWKIKTKLIPYLTCLIPNSLLNLMFCSSRASSLLSFWCFSYQGLSSGWSMVNHYDMQLLLHETRMIFLIFDGSLQTVKVCWSYCINPSVKRFRPGEDRLKNNNIFSELARKIYYTCLKNQFIKMTKNVALFKKEPDSLK